MSPKRQNLLERVAALPEELLGEVEETVDEIVRWHDGVYRLSDDERIAPAREGIPISFVLGFNESGDEMELRNYFFVLRDAIKFLHRKAAG